MTEKNQREVDLLLDNPGQFIVSYQPLIKIVVRIFVRTHYIPEREYDDVVSYINEKLLLKIERIRSQYNGVSLLSTYMSAVIRNLCLEKIREAHSGLVEEPSPYLEYAAYSPANQINNIVIKQEIQRLSKVIETFMNDKSRLLFCLKIMYKVPVSEEEFFALEQADKKEQLDFLWNSFNIHSIIEERDQYKRLAALFSVIDGVERSTDSIRKWVHYRLNQVIAMMNGDPKRANYTDETVQLLFERYFSEGNQSIFYMNSKRGYQNASK
jgi:RNA polymerase sigma factor (sigma-70 family)